MGDLVHKVARLACLGVGGIHNNEVDAGQAKSDRGPAVWIIMEEGLDAVGGETRDFRWTPNLHADRLSESGRRQRIDGPKPELNPLLQSYTLTPSFKASLEHTYGVPSASATISARCAANIICAKASAVEG